MRLSYILILLITIHTHSARAFVEDVCYFHQSNPIANASTINPEPFNCLDFRCSDGTHQGETKPKCLATGLSTFIRAVILPGTPLANLMPSPRFHVRSNMHFDITWIAARLAGISAEDAYWISAYAEATDLAVYRHYNYKGKPIANSTTVDLTGGVRTNTDTYGYWLHFLHWYREDPGMQTAPALSYHKKPAKLSPFPAHEIALNHLRAWAFGQRDTLCEFALTTDRKRPDAPCYSSDQQVVLEVFDPLIIGPTNTENNRQKTTLVLQWQRMQYGGNCQNQPSNARKCYQQQFAKQNSGTLTALGIYIHALADRISHNYCAQSAGLEKATDNSKIDYRLVYPSQCGPLFEIANHNQEQGKIPLPQRTYDSIEFTLKEIQAWVRATNYPTQPLAKTQRNFPQPDNMQAMLRMFGNALSNDTAQERITSLCQIAVKGYRLGWHDGADQCQY